MYSKVSSEVCVIPDSTTSLGRWTCGRAGFLQMQALRLTEERFKKIHWSFENGSLFPSLKKKNSTYTRWWLRNQKGKPSLAVLWCNSPEWFSQSSETFLMLYSTWDVRCPSRRVCCCGECLPELKLLWWYDHLPADTLDSLSPLRPSGNQRCRVLCPFKQSMTSASTLDSPCLPRRLSLSALQQPIIGFFQRSDKCHWLDWRTTSDWFELSSWGGG